VSSRHGIDSVSRKPRCGVECRKEHPSKIIRTSKKNWFSWQSICGEQAAQITNNCLEERSVLILHEESCRQDLSQKSWFPLTSVSVKSAFAANWRAVQNRLWRSINHIVSRASNKVTPHPLKLPTGINSNERILEIWDALLVHFPSINRCQFVPPYGMLLITFPGIPECFSDLLSSFFPQARQVCTIRIRPQGWWIWSGREVLLWTAP